MKRNKKDCMKIHAKNRIALRFNTVLSDQDIDNIITLYQDNRKSIKLGKLTNRLSKGIVWYQDKWIPIVYDKDRKEICTILSLDMLDKTELEIAVRFTTKKILNGNLDINN